MLQVYYLNLKNSNLPAMKPCSFIHSLNLTLLSPQQRSPMLGIIGVWDGTNFSWAGNLASKVDAKNIAALTTAHNQNRILVKRKV
jgi:hypothetical protein